MLISLASAAYYVTQVFFVSIKMEVSKGHRVRDVSTLGRLSP